MLCGCRPQPSPSSARLKRTVISLTQPMKLLRYALARWRNVYDDFVWRRLVTNFGILRSTRRLSRRAKKIAEVRYAVEERAKVALAVASMYPGGDYFEFGSAGFRTLRNFLTAFDLNDLPQALPET